MTRTAFVGHFDAYTVVTDLVSQLDKEKLCFEQLQGQTQAGR